MLIITFHFMLARIFHGITQIARIIKTFQSEYFIQVNFKLCCISDMKSSGKRKDLNNKNITIWDVANLAQVSIGSVSRVLNANATVKPSTRLKVQRAIEQLRFKPNLAAQSIRGKLSRTVSCILRDVEIAGFGRFVRAADKVFMDQGYALQLCNTEGDKTRERELISLVTARRSDAILIAHSTEDDEQLHDLIRRTDVPVVLIDREFPRWADCVVVDHRSAVRTATEELLRLGHRRIALLTGSPTLFPTRERIVGFHEAHQAFGVSVDPTLCRQGSFEQDFGFNQTLLLASSKLRPTAIIAGGIEMLPGVLKALRLLMLRIPQDVSVVGAINTDLSELHNPAISVETWDYSTLGKIAANLVLDRLKEGFESEPRKVVVPSEFILRESVAKPSSALGI
jgi:LacI family transcriptional regulator